MLMSSGSYSLIHLPHTKYLGPHLFLVIYQITSHLFPLMARALPSEVPAWVAGFLPSYASPTPAPLPARWALPCSLKSCALSAMLLSASPLEWNVFPTSPPSRLPDPPGIFLGKVGPGRCGIWRKNSNTLPRGG